MANVSFDFCKIKRSFFTTTLKDGRKLQVKMPMKKTFDKLSALQNMDQSEVAIEDVMDTFGALCAETLSNNLNGETVTADYMVSNYDIEEMTEFVKQFYVFVGGVTDDPN
ncbi:MAG: hypothetical protein NC548_26490 [Lachnospiraceae bacterium]|nr:hypothetical protein [Lachnospiraceae bacterium]